MKTIMIIGEKIFGWVLDALSIVALFFGSLRALPQLPRYVHVKRM